MINILAVGQVAEAVAQERIAALTNELASLTKSDKIVVEKGDNVKKNQKPGVPDPARKYVLLTKSLSKWGKVPQQQQDVASILASGMEVGKEYSEKEVYDMLVDGSGDYDSICKSTQDPTYIFRYYRGLKNDGKYAGLIGRNFIRMVGTDGGSGKVVETTGLTAELK